MIGLFAFFYGCLHFLTWLWLDKLFDIHEMLKDVAKRPFITAGFGGSVVDAAAGDHVHHRLDPPPGRQALAAAAPAGLFHGVAAVVHYYWLVKSDIRLPLLYGALVALALAYRAAAWLVARGRAPAQKRVVPALPIVQ